MMSISWYLIAYVRYVSSYGLPHIQETSLLEH